MKFRKNILQTITIIMFVVILLTNTLSLYAEGVSDYSVNKSEVSEADNEQEEEVIIAEIPTLEPEEAVTPTPEESTEEPVAPTESPAPTEAPMPMETEIPSEAPLPEATVLPTEEPLPAETMMPTEEPAEPEAPSETQIPEESAVPSESPVIEETPLLTETALPTETPEAEEETEEEEVLLDEESNDKNTKTVYQYEDSNIMVTATLQYADAIPDDAEFVVTQVTQYSRKYNYDAYMEALNENADQIAEAAAGEGSVNAVEKYTSDNTLLYDIAFLHPEVDDRGNVISDQMVEFQPAEGAVNISFEFKRNQLENKLDASSDSDVAVVHLPLKEEVKETINTTAEATDIAASDVKVEVVTPEVVVEEEYVDFNLNDFSLIAFVDAGGNDVTTMSPGPDFTYRDALGNAVYFGIVADEFELSNHADTNLAVKYLSFNQNMTNQNVTMGKDTASNNPGYNIIADVESGKTVRFDATNGANRIEVWCTEDGGQRIEFTGNSTGNGKLIYATKEDLEYYVEKLMSHVDSTSAALASNAATYGYTMKEGGIGNEHMNSAEIDISGYADGTYYFNMNQEELNKVQNGGLKIKKNSTQTIVFNFDATNVTLNQFQVTNVDTGLSKLSNDLNSPAEMSQFAETIIFNIPGEAEVTINNSITGTVLAPDANVTVRSTSTGWVVAKKVINSNCEWHCIWNEMPTVDLIPTPPKMLASKTVDGSEPTMEQVFTFVLEKWNESTSTWDSVEEVNNSGSEVTFSPISFASAGNHYFRISEEAGDENYDYDTNSYIAKVNVNEYESGKYAIDSITYYKGTEIDAASGSAVGEVSFNNTVKSGGGDTPVVGETVTVAGNKNWYDTDSNQRPANITIRLYADGVETAQKVVTSSEGWAYSFTDLPKNDGETGNVIHYTIQEDAVSGYITHINGYNVINIRETDISVAKVWEDNNDRDGIRPDSVTVKLLSGGADTGKTITLTESGGWTGTFENLPAFDTYGNAITYSVQEVNVSEGYTAEVTGDVQNGFTVTNTHETEVVEKTVTKVWEDEENANGLRPDSISVQLMEGEETCGPVVELDEENGWTYTWSGLPKYEAGAELEYSVQEITEVPGYETSYSADTFTITNTLETVEVPVEKNWEDAGDRDGIRPDSVTVILFADEEDTGKTLTLSEAGNWKGKFENLPKCNTDGDEIEYSVEETDVPDAYDVAVTGDAENGFVITNTYEAEVVEKTVTKGWDDADDANGLRPTSIVVQLMNGNVYCGEEVELNEENSWTYTWSDLPKREDGEEIVYSVKEITAVPGYETTYSADTFTITNTLETVEVAVTKEWDDEEDEDGLRPDSVTIKLLADGEDTGKTLVLTEAGGWAGSFEELPKYNDEGNEVSYSVEETDVPEDYSSQVTGNMADGYTVTNSYTPGIVHKTVSKEWDDADDVNGLRPASIKVQLMQNEEAYGAEVTLDEENDWSYTWDNLPKKADGADAVYTVEEITQVPGYETTYSDDTFTITNTLEMTEIPVTKEWDDGENQDGMRPDSVTINLFADGVDTGKSITLTEENGFTGAFENLPVLDTDDNAIAYTVKETAVPEGYTAEVTGDAENGFTVTNTHNAEVVEKTVIKVWEDEENANGLRPDSISVQLMEGEETCGPVVELDEENSWTYTWSGLPKYEAGVELEYSVQEITEVPGYETSYSADTFTITNTLETVEVPVEKNWEDAGDRDGIRPDSVTVKLFADEADTGKTLTLSEAGNWKGKFENLPKCNTDGDEIEYSVEETDVPDEYDVAVTGDAENGFVITNTYEAEVVEKTVTKEWDDAEDANGLRPASIVVQLMNGNVYCGEEVELNEENSWTYTWSDLPKCEDGEEIVYSVKEITAVPGYETTYSADTFTITNTLETVEVAVTKEWDDAEDEDGLRPDSVTIKLLADGEDTGKTLVLTEAGGWAGSFEELPKYNDEGNEVSYSVEETDVPEDYSSQVTGNMADGYTVTNSYTPGIVHKTVTKEWDDADDENGLRPASIKVQLMQNEEAYGTEVTLNEENDWSYTWDNLPKKADGADAVYTVEEITQVPGYETTYSADTFTITNTLEMTEIPVTKEWDDGENQDGIRPDSVTVKLYADGQSTGKSLTLSEENDWMGEFTNLLIYNEQDEEIEYTIREDAVPGYAAEPEITGDAEEGFTVTNTRTTDTVSISGKKVWVDNGDAAGMRPESITVVLLADGEEIDSVEVTAEDSWRWSFDGLDKHRVDENGNGGIEIVYTIEEIEVEDYVSVITGDLANGYVITNTYDGEEIEVETTSKTVRKIWDDNKNQDGIRPASIKVQLLADGEKCGSSVTLKADNNWRYTWKNLPVEDEDGYPIEYTVKEISKITGYETTYSPNTFVITNTHKTETTSVSGVKVWNDDNNKKGVRPDRIVVNLYADGVKQTSMVVMADKDGNWKYAFKGLPKYKNGKKINYTITESEVQYYEAQVTGYNLVNTYVGDQPTASPTASASPKATPTPTATVTPQPTKSPAPAETPRITEKPRQTPEFRSTPEPEDDGPKRGRTPKPTVGKLTETKLTPTKVQVSPEKASVLGVRRGLDYAVLGKRRRPVTGDGMELLIWIMLMSMATGSMITSSIMLLNSKEV